MTNSLLQGEKDLLTRVAAGDEKAFSDVFHNWQPFLSTHIYRITESKELTEEIVQDVFLKIWQSRETLIGINHFRAYLLVVSRNHAINALKKIARDFGKWEKWARENKADAEAVEPEQNYYGLLDEAVDQLSARQKEVYLLHRHQRMTYAEIAEKLGIGKESVKTHIELAVKNISAFVKGRLAAIIILFMLGK